MKMKKWIATLMSCAMVMSLAACGSGETAQNESGITGQSETKDETGTVEEGSTETEDTKRGKLKIYCVGN